MYLGSRLASFTLQGREFEAGVWAFGHSVGKVLDQYTSRPLETSSVAASHLGSLGTPEVLR